MSKRVCVYCASSGSCDPFFHETAREMGRLLAQQGYTIVYGGGRNGSMGAVADAALAESGEVVGVLPRFMGDLEWGHSGLSELHLVEDMRTRKHLMLQDSDAVVAMPGGSGTLEELFEAITLKRLGLYFGAIVIVNAKSYFDPLVALLARAIEERFMGEKHAQMWSVVATPEEAIDAIANAAPWSEAARDFAVL
jgi:uncharacterized protein (TIGR00730 family)